LSASPRSAVTSARKRSRGAEYLCDVIYDRSECAGTAIDERGGDVINLATSTPVNGCNRTARAGA